MAFLRMRTSDDGGGGGWPVSDGNNDDDDDESGRGGRGEEAPAAAASSARLLVSPSSTTAAVAAADSPPLLLRQPNFDDGGNQQRNNGNGTNCRTQTPERQQPMRRQSRQRLGSSSKTDRHKRTMKGGGGGGGGITRRSVGRRAWLLGGNAAVGLTLVANIVASMFGNARNVLARGGTAAAAASTTSSSSFNSQSGLQQQQQQQSQQLLLNRAFKVIGAAFALAFFPFLVWRGIPFEDAPLLQQAVIGWDALLHISAWPLVILCLFRSLVVARNTDPSIAAGGKRLESSSAQSQPPPRATSLTRNMIYIGSAFFLFAVVGSQLQIIMPAWIWNPFMLGVRVYRPRELQSHLRTACLDDGVATGAADSAATNSFLRRNYPLCLSREDWKVLGAGALDPSDAHDVAFVQRGVAKVRSPRYGGLILNVMSRDTVDAIPALRQNVEALVPFLKNKLSVVVFENDSSDGTRQAFEKWASEVNDSHTSGYVVDLVPCGDDNPDCKFGLSHRYDSTEAENYFMSSAIGKMSEFRQQIVDYVLGKPYYDEYSHMIVIDLDLQVSLSPLGIMHTIGTDVADDYVVASSGRQTWPGSLGSLMPPYDFSAFRMIETDSNRNMMRLHDAFCGIMPDGDRWRNQCDAVSPVQLMFVLGRDFMYRDEPYQVVSAFNGATMYPLSLIRSKPEAKYNPGPDGQRCEHIGFNVGLNDYMYVNPKWNFHIAPQNPGGPTGPRAMRNVMRIVFTPQISIAIGGQMIVCLVLFVTCVMTLGVHFFYPLLCFASKLVCGSRYSNRYRRYNKNQMWRYSGVTTAKNDESSAYLAMSSYFLNDLTKRSPSAFLYEVSTSADDDDVSTTPLTLSPSCGSTSESNNSTMSSSSASQLQNQIPQQQHDTSSLSSVDGSNRIRPSVKRK